MSKRKSPESSETENRKKLCDITNQPHLITDAEVECKNEPTEALDNDSSEIENMKELSDATNQAPLISDAGAECKNDPPEAVDNDLSEIENRKMPCDTPNQYQLISEGEVKCKNELAEALGNDSSEIENMKELSHATNQPQLISEAEVECKNEQNETIDNDDILLEKLNKILKNTKLMKNYCVSGKSSELPLIPGLKVEGFGLVSLPFTQIQADAMNHFCTDQKNEKIIIHNDRVSFTHPEWDLKLQELVDRTTVQLGCDDKFVPKLIELSICKTGFHQKKIQRPIDKNQFGLLEIILPSEYTGGEFVIYNNEDNSDQVFNFEDTNFAINFTALHANLEHEILEVKSGYRIALIYSLCWAKDDDALNYELSKQNVLETKNILRELENPEIQIGVMLENRYSNLSAVKSLKQEDLARYNLLSKANDLLEDDEKFIFFLTHSKNMIEYYECGKGKRYFGDDGHSVTYSFEAGSDNEEPKKKIIDKYQWYFSTKDKFVSECMDPDGEIILGGEMKSFGHIEKFKVKKSKLDLSTFSHILSPKEQVIKNDLELEKNWGCLKDIHVEGYTRLGLVKTVTYHLYKICFMRKSHFNLISLALDPIEAIKSISYPIYPNYMKSLLYSFKKKPISETSNKNRYCGFVQDFWKKLTQILIHYNDLDMTRQFLEELKEIKIDDLGYILELINYFGYNLLIDILIKFIKIDVSNISFNCEFIQKMYLRGLEEDSYDYFTKTVMPFSTVSSEDQNNWNLILPLVRTMKFFSSKNSDLQSILDNLVKLVVTRVEELRDLIYKAELVKWCMPNTSIPGHPQVEQFFHRNESEMHYRNFSSIHNARKFVHDFTKSKDYSCEMEAYGSGHRSMVTIKKTRYIFQDKDKELRVSINEYNRLKSYI
ncbi:unnamed protein product [Brachionus calyciflorus]|uniref:Prolyl 4-hydroxylase alpha subunit Fe(2+) 2OG dioxygenase domain-containing protein n=1 Tax=Brachionus calyciflorus TaxID=104777 RepID=A0A813PK97_9BILA|nr:unnamed protein product [Brachionus calyciflorus]